MLQKCDTKQILWDWMMVLNYLFKFKNHLMIKKIIHNIFIVVYWNLSFVFVGMEKIATKIRDHRNSAKDLLYSTKNKTLQLNLYLLTNHKSPIQASIFCSALFCTMSGAFYLQINGTCIILKNNNKTFYSILRLSRCSEEKTRCPFFQLKTFKIWVLRNYTLLWWLGNPLTFINYCLIITMWMKGILYVNTFALIHKMPL